MFHFARAALRIAPCGVSKTGGYVPRALALPGWQMAHSTAVLRSMEELQSVDVTPRAKVVKTALTQQESSKNWQERMPIDTITWFEGSSEDAGDQIRSRLAGMIAFNPWLIGMIEPLRNIFLVPFSSSPIPYPPAPPPPNLHPSPAAPFSCALLPPLSLDPRL